MTTARVGSIAEVIKRLEQKLSTATFGFEDAKDVEALLAYVKKVKRGSGDRKRWTKAD